MSAISLIRAMTATVGCYAWQFVALTIGLMVSLAILLAALALKSPPPPRFKFETITFQRDGYTRQSIYKIDTETGSATEVVSSLKK